MQAGEGRVFFPPKAMGSSMVDIKAGGQILWWVNAMLNQVLDIRILRDNSQDQIVLLLHL